MSIPQSEIQLSTEGAVVISYPTLLSKPESLQASISKAFGSDPDCLGIIIVKDLPVKWIKLRESLLSLANQFAALPEHVRDKYMDPTSKYSFGWSHGKVISAYGVHDNQIIIDSYSKEIMNGKPDTLKGSYYANPMIDTPTVSEEQKIKFPEYYGLNVWPDSSEAGVEGFEVAFKLLGQFIFRIGRELATACQPFAGSHLVDQSLTLPDLISTQTTKARLLHYFPPSLENSLPPDDEPIDSWCGFHLDHSLLTGLCSAMYLYHEPSGKPRACSPPSKATGLYIKTRGGILTKVSIPPDCLAFQTGEALELATDGKLRATPHCVRVGGGPGAEKISRETFALFMQPDTEQKIGPKETFGSFSKGIFDLHYDCDVGLAH